MYILCIGVTLWLTHHGVDTVCSTADLLLWQAAAEGHCLLPVPTGTWPILMRKEGWKDGTDKERRREGGGEGGSNKKKTNELKEGDRQTVIPLKSILCLGTTNIFFPSTMDLKGLKGMSAYITIHKHRLFGLLHWASSSQSVIVFPDAKSLCSPLPFTITPLIIPD